MGALVFSNEAEAQKLASDVDAAMGYPRDGTDVGGGVHVPPELGRTLRHREVLKHPTKGEYAYVLDEACRSCVLRLTSKKEADLPADWQPVKELGR